MSFLDRFPPQKHAFHHPTVMTTTHPNVGPTTTHSYSIDTSTYMQHEERALGYLCVFLDVQGLNGEGIC